ncbi:MAG: hypothetical protein ACRDVG_06105 [Jatrophihabitantaceae bacterium]
MASSGMIGGFSPGFVLGPVRGTSAGSVGRPGRGGPAWEVEGSGVVGETVVIGAVGDDEPLGAAPEDVQAAHDSAANAVIVQIRRTPTSCPTGAAAASAARHRCGQPATAGGTASEMPARGADRRGACVCPA